MKWYQSLGLGLAAVILPVFSGCAPLSMGIFTPIPVPPWVTERMEDKYAFKNDNRTPVLPPIREGFPLPHRLERLRRGGHRGDRRPGRRFHRADPSNALPACVAAWILPGNGPFARRSA